MSVTTHALTRHVGGSGSRRSSEKSEHAGPTHPEWHRPVVESRLGRDQGQIEPAMLNRSHRCQKVRMKQERGTIRWQVGKKTADGGTTTNDSTLYDTYNYDEGATTTTRDEIVISKWMMPHVSWPCGIRRPMTDHCRTRTMKMTWRNL